MSFVGPRARDRGEPITFKTKAFFKWAEKEGVTDSALNIAVQEIEKGLVDANLGGALVKKRIPLAGRGKRGGARTIVAFQSGHHVFFIYGFSKNEKDSLDKTETAALKQYAKVLLRLSDDELDRLVQSGDLRRVEADGK